jgi:hypothetical protein
MQSRPDSPCCAAAARRVAASYAPSSPPSTCERRETDVGGRSERTASAGQRPERRLAQGRELPASGAGGSSHLLLQIVELRLQVLALLLQLLVLRLRASRALSASVQARRAAVARVHRPTDPPGDPAAWQNARPTSTPVANQPPAPPTAWTVPSTAPCAASAWQLSARRGASSLPRDPARGHAPGSGAP